MADNSLIQKFSTHLVLLVLGGLLFIGVGAIGARQQTDEVSAEPSAVEVAGGTETTLADGQADVVGSVVGVELANLQQVPTVDLNQVPILSEDAVVPELDPNTFVGTPPSHNFQIHLVERGDAPQNIADRYNITTETILGANPALSNEASLLQTGVELIILPVNGVLHTVQRGDTLEAISIRYSIPQEDIIAYADNNLEFPYRLFPDTQLVIPGAEPEAGFVWNPPTLASIAGSPEALDLPVFVTGTGFHLWPVGARRLTQGYWVGHQAIDIGMPEGGSVVATDRGTVTYAAWSVYCYGNLVVVNHGATGHETFYAHLSSIAVKPGQIVEKGQYLGASGNTGCSSGPHLHYEIRIFQNRDNPLFYLP